MESAPNPSPDARQSPNTLPYESYHDEKGYAPYPQPYQAQASEVVAPRNTARRRFRRILLFSFFTWCMFRFFVRDTMSDLRWVYHRHWNAATSDDWDYTVPGGISLQECVQGEEWSPSDGGSSKPRFPFYSETSFTLPISSETLFFVSRGQRLIGAVDVVTSKEQAQDSATVRVTVGYHREEVRDLAKACVLSRNDDENGVGFFTPVWRSGRSPRGREYELGYNMTIILPDVSSFSSPLAIKNFETDVQNTFQHIEDPDHKLFFHSISLTGSNGPVSAKSLTATKANIQTSNGPITGIFNVTKSLELKSSNSPISVAVGLESEDADTVPTLEARTSNGPLHADISLTSASGTGGSFDITTTTSNSPLRVTFSDSPVDSRLSLKASTSNSPATVSLHPAYEGTFTVQTSLFGPTLRRKSDVEDPSGEGRERNVKFGSIGKGPRVLTGEVYWDEKRKDEGAVSVRTSNSPVVLEI
ncbi:hypothetical protein GALMADRAFT_237095 [Galerina marginata CBS 339.88]|uniref:DUF7330 domain-containing protein n=1 Tax=Galerina marginata (strain CBS 339.88) TaxID=685588 RepID=A0A067TWH1_GALM3|nr:hypothetical protein GALMADRAFT_237095 [Galerina marginata CBS 339.88]